MADYAYNVCDASNTIREIENYNTTLQKSANNFGRPVSFGKAKLTGLRCLLKTTADTLQNLLKNAEELHATLYPEIIRADGQILPPEIVKMIIEAVRDMPGETALERSDTLRICRAVCKDWWLWSQPLVKRRLDLRKMESLPVHFGRLARTPDVREFYCELST